VAIKVNDLCSKLLTATKWTSMAIFFNGKGLEGPIDAALNPGCGTSYKHSLNIHIKYNLVMEVHT
jgi:hypothetical protein